MTLRDQSNSGSVRDERPVTVSFTVQEANMLAESAEAGLGHAYVEGGVVRAAAARLVAAAEQAVREGAS